MRSSLLEALHQDFVRATRARGLRESRVVLSHALRNALLPVVSAAGVRFSEPPGRLGLDGVWRNKVPRESCVLQFRAKDCSLSFKLVSVEPLRLRSTSAAAHRRAE
jgi:hypothetical protein